MLKWLLKVVRWEMVRFFYWKQSYIYYSLRQHHYILISKIILSSSISCLWLIQTISGSDHSVDHQRRLSVSNDWEPTGIGRKWFDETANFEVTLRSQNVTWIITSSYSGPVAGLLTVKRKVRYCRKILVRIDAVRVTTTIWDSSWRVVDQCSLSVLDLEEGQWNAQHSVTQLLDGLARAQWYFFGPTFP